MSFPFVGMRAHVACHADGLHVGVMLLIGKTKTPAGGWRWPGPLTGLIRS
jgi:hypothetical protein